MAFQDQGRCDVLKCAELAIDACCSQMAWFSYSKMRKQYLMSVKLAGLKTKLIRLSFTIMPHAIT